MDQVARPNTDTSWQDRDPATELPRDTAATGWLVEIVLTVSPHGPESRYFAVGRGLAREAEQAVVDFPGILPEDRRIALRRLSLDELRSVGLRAGAVRPFRLRSGPPT